jgi:hypothetical protein
MRGLETISASKGYRFSSRFVCTECNPRTITQFVARAPSLMNFWPYFCPNKPLHPEVSIPCVLYAAVPTLNIFYLVSADT